MKNSASEDADLPSQSDDAEAANKKWIVESHDHLVQLSIWRLGSGGYSFRSFAKDASGRRKVINRVTKKLANFSALASREVKTEWARLGIGHVSECRVTPFFEVVDKEKPKPGKTSEKIIVPRPHDSEFFDPTTEFIKLPFQRGHLCFTKQKGIPPLAKVLWGVLVAWAIMEWRPGIHGPESTRRRRIEKDGRVGVQLTHGELAEAAGASQRAVEENMGRLKRAGFLWWNDPDGSPEGITVFFLRYALTGKRPPAENAGGTPAENQRLPAENAGVTPAETAPPYIEEDPSTGRSGRRAVPGGW